MEYKVFRNPNKNDIEFWSLTGWFFASRKIEKEMGSPIHHDNGMNWVIAIENDKTVGISATEIKKNGIAYLKHAYVLPEYRKRGIYNEMVKRRLHLLVDARIIKAVCTDMSLPLLKEFGFREYGKRGRYTLVEYEW